MVLGFFMYIICQGIVATAHAWSFAQYEKKLKRRRETYAINRNRKAQIRLYKYEVDNKIRAPQGGQTSWMYLPPFPYYTGIVWFEWW